MIISNIRGRNFIFLNLEKFFPIIFAGIKTTPTFASHSKKWD
jgi:hypothetical protein